MKELLEVVKKLAKKAGDEHSADHAMKIAQAALNLTQAYGVWYAAEDSNNPRAETRKERLC